MDQNNLEQTSTVDIPASKHALQVAADFNYLRQHCGHPLTKKEDLYQHALQLMRYIHPTLHTITREPPCECSVSDDDVSHALSPVLKDAIDFQTAQWL